MNTELKQAALAGSLALIISLILVPIFVRMSHRWGWMDKPGGRKVHAKPIPVIGGMVIFLSVTASLLITGHAPTLFTDYPYLTIGSVLLFATGFLDDRINIRPRYRLLIQLGMATMLAVSGNRISTLHGLFGWEEIPVYMQYLLTIVIITGVTNAFNLIDGIDGLAGGLAAINLLILSVISFYLGEYSLFLLFATLTGALIVFLKNNIHPARIFMGDAGSLLFGFLMSATGIYLIEESRLTSPAHSETIVVLVCAILLVPVFDSLRVYIWRMRRGESPFKADNTHLHHLMLLLNPNPKKVAFWIYTIELLIIVFGLVIHQFASISISILFLVLFFLLIAQLLQLNFGVHRWTRKIREMGNSA